MLKLYNLVKTILALPREFLEACSEFFYAAKYASNYWRWGE